MDYVNTTNVNFNRTMVVRLENYLVDFFDILHSKRRKVELADHILDFYYIRDCYCITI